MFENSEANRRLQNAKSHLVAALRELNEVVQNETPGWDQLTSEGQARREEAYALVRKAKRLLS